MFRVGAVCCLALVALLCSWGVPFGQQVVPTPASATVIVEWTTESEVNMAGFNIYRSESPEGPYAKLNDALIPASSDPFAGQSYSFTDTTARAGETYYYKLEDVELDGGATMHGPITLMAEDRSVWQISQPAALAVLLAAGLVVCTVTVVIGRSVFSARRR